MRSTALNVVYDTVGSTNVIKLRVTEQTVDTVLAADQLRIARSLIDTVGHNIAIARRLYT